jgi:hypothetical protein
MTAVWYNPVNAPCDGPVPHATVIHWNVFLDLLKENL